MTGRGEAADGAGFSQVLVVTSSVGMVHGVHADTSDSGESLSLSFELVEEHSCLHDGFFVASSSCDDANGGSAETVDGLPGARGQSDSGLAAIIGVADDGGVGARASGVLALVAHTRLDVADGGSLRDLVDG